MKDRTGALVFGMVFLKVLIVEKVNCVDDDFIIDFVAGFGKIILSILYLIKIFLSF